MSKRDFLVYLSNLIAEASEELDQYGDDDFTSGCLQGFQIIRERVLQGDFDYDCE